MNKYYKIAIITLVAVFALAALGCNNDSQEQSDVQETSDVQEQTEAQEPKMTAREWADLASKTEPISADAGQEGSTVGDFELPLYDGGTFKTADFKGKITYLIFWYST